MALAAPVAASMTSLSIGRSVLPSVMAMAVAWFLRSSPRPVRGRRALVVFGDGRAGIGAGIADHLEGVGEQVGIVEELAEVVGEVLPHHADQRLGAFDVAGLRERAEEVDDRRRRILVERGHEVVVGHAGRFEGFAHLVGALCQAVGEGGEAAGGGLGHDAGGDQAPRRPLPSGRPSA